MPEISGKSYRRRLITAAVVVALIAVAAFPLATQSERSGMYLVFSWLAVVPTVYGLRHSPANLRTQWWLIFSAILLSAVNNTLHLWLPNRGVVDVVASMLLLTAAAGLVIKRGGNDYSGLIDASLAAISLGGLLWVVVLQPRMDANGLTSGEAIALGVIVLVLCGTWGALIRLVETDQDRTRALRLFLAALTFNLAGFVLTGWGGAPARVIGVMSFMVAYIALSVVGFDPSMRRLARPGPPRDERLSSLRLVLLGLALSIPAIVNGFLLLTGARADATVSVLVGVVMVPLVMLRIGLLAKSRDRLAEALAVEADHDPLTGLLNRRAFTEALDRELASPRDCTLIFCDLDDFKEVNDRYGHAAGDRVLVEIAGRLRRSVRAGDHVGRFGGDEFLALLSDCGADRAGALVERVRSALARPFEESLDGVTVGASLGAVVSEAATRDGTEIDDLIRVADEAMYAQKQIVAIDGAAGRGSTVPPRSLSHRGPKALRPEPDGDRRNT
ncbi:diguanylate cyclase (GGDEF)-like protein [Hamadaea flava]|uniref:Diguanylate cyclase domain-containing protein n=1 Tax=Hamadaea flava TaxID=1742688 RepID=A0ABV8M0A2_9ACTN|nr:GGDEF domain-containing protein [Hamadaea flava]MCP2328955.1 diguanylate cyclase (GGDEF)-like protein [Hamadaea flava]